MWNYLTRRLLLAIPTFLGITVITFAIVHLAPGDPLQSQSLDGVGGVGVSPQVYEQMRSYWGLDLPLYEQYARWLGRLVRLDFGQSFTDHRPVLEKIAERLPWTLSLAVVSLGLGLAAAIPIGVWSAVRRGGWFDRVSGTLLFGAYSVPNYVMALGLVMLVVWWPIDWLPTGGVRSDDFDRLTTVGKLGDLAKHYFLITFCFAYPSVAYQARFVRGSMLEVLRQDYMRTAAAKGLASGGVVWGHGFRNALMPLVTMLGLLFPTLMSGSVILEVIFNWPGIGRLFYSAVGQRDYPTVMALSVMGAGMVLVGTLLADVGYCLVDPRVRVDGKGASVGSGA